MFIISPVDPEDEGAAEEEDADRKGRVGAPNLIGPCPS